MKKKCLTMIVIALITLNQDSFGSLISELRIGPLCYPHPADVVDSIIYIKRRKPGIIIVDTASISPEMAKEHFVSLKEAKEFQFEFKLFATSGDDPKLPWVTYVENIKKLKDHIHT